MKPVLKEKLPSLRLIIFLVVAIAGLILALCYSVFFTKDFSINPTALTAQDSLIQSKEKTGLWEAPKIDTIADHQRQQLISYGKELIVNTSKYLGPNGLVGKLSNGMNCQNCHLDAGTRHLGNNYAAVYANYPKFRARSGTKETIIKRISDCMERSLNGTKLDSNGIEMRAMVAYINFIGSGVKKGVTPKGVGLEKLAYLNRAADPQKGKLVYKGKCISCHGTLGEGISTADGKSFIYPPLWGPKSYNDAAGLYRISNFAGYVKNNMPFGATYQNQILTDEEAWDLAAYVNNQPRPHQDQSGDWPDVSKKPIDFPQGPYADKFTAMQHKFGPFKPIETMLKNSK